MAAGPDYRRDIHPHLDCETVYGHWQWEERKPRAWGWRSRHCPHCGEGSSKPGRLSADPQTLGFKCHHCGASGDPPKWLQVAEGLDFKDAAAELARRKGIAQRRGPSPSRRMAPSERTANPSHPKSSEIATRKARHAQVLWNAAAAADGTPAATYLAARRAWPVMLAWPIPTELRWIAADAVRRVLSGWALPANADGCLACAYRGPAGALGGLKLEALDASGNRCDPRWRRNLGELKGLRFTAWNADGGQLHVAEGELTAMSIAVRCAAQGKGASVAVSGTSCLIPEAVWDAVSRPVTICADRDPSGREAAWKLREALQTAGRNASATGLTECASDGQDKLDELAADIGERAGIRTFDGGLAPDEAERVAWQDIVREARDTSQ